MAALDPFDVLVRMGKLRRAELEAADLVDTARGTSTRAARLVAVGVDKDKLLKALSELTRIAVASPEKLAAAAPMELPPSYATTMKELLAVPIGRVDDQILEIAIADPRTTTKLKDLAIAHHPRLALEPDVVDALARVFPEVEVLDPLHEPTLKEVALPAPRPITVDVPAPITIPSKSDEQPAVVGQEIPPPPPPPVSLDRPRPPREEPEVTMNVRSSRGKQAEPGAAQELPAAPAAMNLDPRYLVAAVIGAVVVAAVVLAAVLHHGEPRVGESRDAGEIVVARPADAGVVVVDAGSAVVDASPNPPAPPKPVHHRPLRRPPHRKGH